MNEPEPERLIRCKGADWSEFECTGKMVRYKDQKQHRGQRFFRRNQDGTFEVDREIWKSVTSWEYLDK